MKSAFLMQLPPPKFSKKRGYNGGCRQGNRRVRMRDVSSKTAFQRLPLAGATGAMIMALFCLQCESLSPGIRINSFGEYDPALEQILATRALNVDSLHGVRVFEGEFPEGVSITEGGAKILIQEEHAAKYEALGVVEADYLQSGQYSSFFNYLWTWSDYEAGWRTALCYAQAPLKALSLGIWNLSPSAWPCFKHPPDEKTRKQELIERLLQAAKALDGNILIIADQGEILITTEDGEILDNARYVNLHGFVLREK